MDSERKPGGLANNGQAFLIFQRIFVARWLAMTPEQLSIDLPFHETLTGC